MSLLLLFKGATGGQTLTPALFTNTQTFYSATTTPGPVTLNPSLFSNTQTFYDATTTASITLTPLLFTNTQTFYTGSVVVAGGTQTLNPNLYTNLQTFYSTTITQTAPIVLIDTHDGDKGKRQKKRWDDEQAARERHKAQIVDVYEQLVEGRPAVAEQIVAPYIQKETQSTQPAVDFDRLLADVDRIERLYREYQEMDDEEVLLLL